MIGNWIEMLSLNSVSSIRMQQIGHPNTIWNIHIDISFLAK